MREADADPAEPTVAVVCGMLGVRDLEDHADDTLTNLGSGAVHLGAAVGMKHDPSRTGVVEALGVTDVLEADRETDPALHAFAAGRVARAARQSDRVARQRLGRGNGDRGCGADRLGHRAGALDHLTRGQDVARAERVQEAQLDRVDVELRREQVHLRFCRKARLHGPETAHRPARRIIGIDRCGLDQGVVDAVRADRERRSVGRNGGRAGRIRTAVEQDPHLHVHKPAVAGGAMLAPHSRGVPVDVSDERLLAVVNDLHRPARVQSEQGAVELHREVLSAAERATDTGEMDSHLLGGKPETRSDLVTVDVEPLGCDVDVDAALAVRNGEPRLGPEERLILDPDVVDAGDGDVAFGLRVAVADDHVADDVRARIVAVAVTGRRATLVERCHFGGALHV
jgi:hypothetical protein